MKLITLNLWGGKINEPLIKFITHYDEKVDIFCFQEAYKEGTSHREHLGNMDMNIFGKIQAILNDYQGFFSPTQDGEEGMAMFVIKRITIESFSESFVFLSKNSMRDLDVRTMGRVIQVMQFVSNGKRYSVINFHGLWNGNGKTDTPDRLLQSQKIRKEMDKLSGDKILCGDFNLEPTTESLAILEKGLRNLIKDNGITSTRSKFYEKPVKFADYILVSPDVKVKDFRVLPDEISDHLPLYLEFS